MRFAIFSLAFCLLAGTVSAEGPEEEQPNRSQEDSVGRFNFGSYGGYGGYGGMGGMGGIGSFPLNGQQWDSSHPNKKATDAEGDSGNTSEGSDEPKTSS
ncbi:hypothetical protein V5799_026291 [Amblyomma americanum]|uniref:Secreted protein n=1 Tax=Amblyomma americanum TaxID=6943 RepID=A0AAQ4DJ02_AMBAM